MTAAPPARYTHGHDESVLRSHRWRTVSNSAAYLIPSLVSGHTVLDVGCGPGTVTVDIAGYVTPGCVVGIDRAVPLLANTAREARGADVVFLGADLFRLPFPDARFDVVHAHQVLQHVAEPVAALREMRRVCDPEGVVAARDSDYAAMVWYPADPLLDRWLSVYREVARANGGEPDAGRYLRSWALQAGFETVTASASAWCFAEPADRAWWGGLWADRTTQTDLGSRALELGLASQEDLQAIADAWQRWAVAEDAWFAVLHGEVICRGGSGE